MVYCSSTRISEAFEALPKWLSTIVPYYTLERVLNLFLLMSGKKLTSYGSLRYAKFADHEIKGPHNLSSCI